VGGTTSVAIERVRKLLKIEGIAGRCCAKECVIPRKRWAYTDMIRNKGVGVRNRSHIGESEGRNNLLDLLRGVGAQ